VGTPETSPPGPRTVRSSEISRSATSTL
jgi:hypothetical protein